MSRLKEAQLAAACNFALTLARLDAAVTCSAAEKSEAICAQLETALAALASLDETSQKVAEEQFTALARTALAAVADMHTQTRLPGAAFQCTENPPTRLGERIRHWCESKFLPWWQDESW